MSFQCALLSQLQVNFTVDQVSVCGQLRCRLWFQFSASDAHAERCTVAPPLESARSPIPQTYLSATRFAVPIPPFPLFTCSSVLSWLVLGV